MTVRSRLALSGLAALMLTLAPFAGAWAHTALTSSTPADGAVVRVPPTAVELTFEGTVADPASVVVTDPAGRNLTVGKAEVVDGLVTQDVVDSRAAGTYTIEYRVVSDDGHPVSGTLRFTVRPGNQPPPTRSSGTAGSGAAGSDTATPETGEKPVVNGFWDALSEPLTLAGIGLLVGVGVLGAGLRGRR